MIKVIIFGLLLMVFNACSLDVDVPVDEVVVDLEPEVEEEVVVEEETVVEDEPITTDAIRTAFVEYRPEYSDYYSDVALNESIDIEQVEGDYAWGYLGGWWYAKRVDGVWTIAASGNGEPSCESVDGFPESFNIVCW